MKDFFIKLSNEKKRKKAGSGEALYGFLLISFSGVLIFYLLPFAGLVYYSLVDNPISGQFAGLENFKDLLSNHAFLTAVKNSFRFALISVPSIMLLSLAMAVLMEEALPARILFRSLFLSPLMVPSASVILVWRALFCSSGILSRALSAMTQQDIDFFRSGAGILVILLLFLWKNAGYFMVVYMSALSRIPKELLDAAGLDGAGSIQKLWYIKIPYLLPSMMFVFLLSCIGAFKIFKEVYLLCGAHPSESLYLLQHFMNNAFWAFDYQKLASAAILLALGLSILIGALLWLEDRAGRDLEG